MDFKLTDEQELLIESAREYATRYFTDEAVKQAYEVDHHISIEAAMAYREAGFMHLGLPEEVGGVPVDKLTEVLLVEKLHEFTGVTLPFVTDFNTITDVIDFGTKGTAGNDHECYRKCRKHLHRLFRNFRACCWL